MTRIKIAHKTTGPAREVFCPCYVGSTRARFEAWVKKNFADYLFLYVVEG
jgi:hypothetical protein